MLKHILSISGKPGLYKLLTRGNNMLVVESLLDHKRMPTYNRDKIVSLSDVSMYTTGEDIALSDVLTALGKHQELKPVTMDIRAAQPDELRAFFAEILPDFDRDRVYPTDIKKLLQWYNILIEAGITDFSVKEDEEGETLPVQQETKNDTAKAVKQTSVKTQKKSAGAAAKTGVGAKKG